MGEHEHGHTEIAEHGHEHGHSCCDEHGCHAHELTHEHGHGEKTEKTEGDLLGDGGIIKTIVRKGDAEGGKPPVVWVDMASWSCDGVRVYTADSLRKARRLTRAVWVGVRRRRPMRPPRASQRTARS